MIDATTGRESSKGASAIEHATAFAAGSVICMLGTIALLGTAIPFGLREKVSEAARHSGPSRL